MILGERVTWSASVSVSVKDSWDLGLSHGKYEVISQLHNFPETCLQVTKFRDYLQTNQQQRDGSLLLGPLLPSVREW